MDWLLLAPLDEADRREVLAAARRCHFARGELLVREGDPATSLHLVVSGRLQVRKSTYDGANATLNVLGPGDYFGELSLLDGRPATRSASILAMEPAETLSLSASAFAELRRAHRGAEQLLLMLLARRVEHLSARLVEAMYDPMEVRVCRRLLELATGFPADPDGSVVVPLTQTQLAEVVGGARPTVNQVLQRLAARSLVELARGRIIVRDLEWLRRRAG